MNRKKTSKRGRPQKESVMETIAVRLPDEIISEIDLYVLNLKKKFPMMNITRADAIRELINNSLQQKHSVNLDPREKINPDNSEDDFEEKKRKFWE